MHRDDLPADRRPNRVEVERPARLTEIGLRHVDLELGSVAQGRGGQAVPEQIEHTAELGLGVRQLHARARDPRFVLALRVEDRDRLTGIHPVCLRDQELGDHDRGP